MEMLSTSERSRSTSRGRLWVLVAQSLAVLILFGSGAVPAFAHMRAVALAAHQSGLVAVALPVAVLGALAIGCVAAYLDRVDGRRVRAWAVWQLVVHLVAVAAANMTAVMLTPGWNGLVVAAANAGSLMLVIAVVVACGWLKTSISGG